MNVLSLENFQIEVAEKIRVEATQLALEKGQIYALVGKNGSGKSSLLSGIMTCPGTKIKGSGVILGQDIGATTLDQKARDGIIYIAQKQPEIEGLSLIQLLFGMYVREPDQNLTIIEYKKKLTQELELYGLNAELLMRPIGTGLSGGEKKQAELITLIASEPKLALIDEIDSGVDIGMIDIIAKVLVSLKAKEATILIVSHNFELLKKLEPSAIYLTDEGKLIYYGDKDSLDVLKSQGFVTEK